MKAMFRVTFTVMIIVMVSTNSLKGQKVKNEGFFKGSEISTGFSFLIYQSAYGFNASQGIEFLYSNRVAENYKAEAGFRSSVNSFKPEGFIRGVVYFPIKSWQPAIGFETGISNRAVFESSGGLLKEARESMLKDLGHCYLSAHIEALSFNISGKLNVSFLEFDIGTHYRNIGRTLRAQSTLVRLRKTF